MTQPAERILVRRDGKRLVLKLNRPENRNSLDDLTLARYHELFDQAERDNEVRMIVLEGSEKVFCSGMDLEAFASGNASAAGNAEGGGSPQFMRLFKRISTIDRIVVSKVEGEATAGGIGLVAASDLVFAGPKATFALSEALWGLLPAMVMPFLVRRIGYQPAYRMTLTTQPIDANEALRVNLADVVTPDLDAAIQQLSVKLFRLHAKTVADMKAYFRKMWIVDDDMEKMAVEELGRLVREPRVRQNITNYVEFGRLPWDSW